MNISRCCNFDYSLTRSNQGKRYQSLELLELLSTGFSLEGSFYSYIYADKGRDTTMTCLSMISQCLDYEPCLVDNITSANRELGPYPPGFDLDSHAGSCH